MSRDILVLGATGLVGGHVVRFLMQAGERVRAASRDPERARARLPSSVQVVAFDLERRDTWARALVGIEALFLMARPGDDSPETAAVPLLEEAKRQGVLRVVDLSAMGAEARDDFGLRRVEKALESSGFAWTHLRPNWFFQMLSSGLVQAGIQTRGVIALPLARARVSYLDAREIGEAAARVLTQPGHENRAYTLTGAEALDHDEVASLIGKAAGRAVAYLPIDDEKARQILGAAGFSSQRADRLLMFYGLMRRGACELVVKDLEEILGRRPLDLTRYAQEHASCWASR
jgi:uncharacterized protein YbjT (DUF2867 family)